MTDNVTIAVDAMGGDNAPEVVLEGVAAALAADEGLTVILCGPADVVEPFAAQHARCRAQVAAEVIDMAEHPAQAVRKKKDSSIVVGCRLVKDGQAQGFFSAGSTGACLAAATLVMGRIKGISRPCLATVVPSPVRPIVLCDVGANADCKPEYLVQFAQMGSVYAQKTLRLRVAQGRASQHRRGRHQGQRACPGGPPAHGQTLDQFRRELRGARCAGRAVRSGGHRWVYRQRVPEDHRGRFEGAVRRHQGRHDVHYEGQESAPCASKTA